jgi:pyridoxal phosphate enzyme (YggS family)
LSTLTERFDTVCERLEKALVRSGRTRDSLELVAVSKTHPAASVAELAAYWSRTGRGRTQFGENYVQEALEKMPQVATLLAARADECLPAWHFIGHLQSRKSKDIIGCFSLIHSLDSLKTAQTLQKAWDNETDETQKKPQDVLIQVNIGHEAQKSGVEPEELEDLLNKTQALPGVRVRGLMCLPPLAEIGEQSRPYFIMLAALRTKMEKLCGLDLPCLSMGMSGDFECAVEEGATLVRIGTDIFGTRVYP